MTRLTPLRPSPAAVAPGRSARRAAFTLVELLTVIVVMSILAGMVLVAVRTGGQSSRAQTTKHVLAQVGAALEQFRSENGSHPPERTTDYSSAESLAFYLGTEANFLTLNETMSADLDGDGHLEVLDAFGQSLVYNRWMFPNDESQYFVGNPSSAANDTHRPIHNPKEYDLFSVGSLASHISALNPKSSSYDERATLVSGTRYALEEKGVGNRINKYIGNW